MKTLAQKIQSESFRISREYVAILESGMEPTALAAIIERTRYGILEVVADGRTNCADALERVKLQAHYNIKCELQLRPALAQRLIDFRAARKARDQKQTCDEQKSWRALPSIR